MVKNKKIKNIVLSIETSVEGGSLSLLENEKEVDFWQGSGSISKSEDILDELSKLLKKNTIERSQIRQIVISRGPGSFTGTRIGLATALGLKKSLECGICGVSVLEAMTLKADWNNSILTAIPIGKKVCLQKFKIGQKSELNKAAMPCLLSFGTFIKQLEDDLESRFVLYGKLYRDVLASVRTENPIIERIIDSGENLAYLIGRREKEKCAFYNLQPIYIKDTR